MLSKNVPQNPTALIVVDMQNGFCTTGGSFVEAGLVDVSKVERCTEAISAVIAEARVRNHPVFFTRQFYPLDPAQWDSATRRRFDPSQVVLAPDSWDNAIIDALPVDPSDIVIDKPRYDGFYNTRLEEELRARGVDRVVVAGALTNVCVLLTAMGAWARGFEFAVPSDTTTARTEDLKEFALQTAAPFGDVRPWREVLGGVEVTDHD